MYLSYLFSFCCCYSEQLFVNAAFSLRKEVKFREKKSQKKKEIPVKITNCTPNIVRIIIITHIFSSTFKLLKKRKKKKSIICLDLATAPGYFQALDMKTKQLNLKQIKGLIARAPSNFFVVFQRLTVV